MPLRILALGPVLAGCALVALTSCSTDEEKQEAGLAPSMSPAVAAVSAYDIVKVPSITVDGNLSDWADVAAISMADNSGRSGGVDNTAQVKLAWDDSYLYAAYDVTDTELLAIQTARDDGDIYKDDEVELYVDPQGDGAGAASMTPTDYQFLANVQDAVGDNHGDGAGGKDASFNASSLLAKAAINGSLNVSGADVGYTVELRVSWSDLGVSPSAGHFMRMDLAVGDRDGSGPPPVQDFDWAGLGIFNNPSGWKDVQLVDPPPPAADYDVTKVASMAIDGNLSDWAGIPAVSMTDDDDRGAATNSATVKLAWNDTYLYAAYDVSDTELLAVQTGRDASEIYKDDEVELYLDPQGDGESATSMTATDYQFLANVRDAISDYRGNGSGDKDGSYNAGSYLSKAVTNGTLNVTGTDVGYQIEFRIAWSDLGVTPTAGHVMGTDLAVGDRDAGTPPVQDFDWAGLTTTYNNPSAWKRVRLVGGGTQPSGIPFGLFALHPDNTNIPNHSIWTAAHITTVRMVDMMNTLRDAKQRSPRIGMWLNLTSGGEQAFMNPDGSFSLALWKSIFDDHVGPFKGNGTSIYNDSIIGFIQDGTFRGHMMLDDLGAFTPDPNQAQIDSMAAHSKRRFPTLLTAVRSKPTSLKNVAPTCSSCPGGKKPYGVLDMGWAQYVQNAGNPATYRDNEIQASKDMHLGLVMGMNIRKGMIGGDDPVPADSISKWGSILLQAGSSDRVCAFIMWDAAFSGLGNSAFNTLASKAQSHVATSCSQH